MLISQLISICLANHNELCMSRLLNNQPRRISIYRNQRRPSFGFESLVSSTLLTSGDPENILYFICGSNLWQQVRHFFLLKLDFYCLLFLFTEFIRRKSSTKTTYV